MDTPVTASEHLAQLQEAVADAPKDAELTISLGEALLREGRVEDAVVTYTRAVELDPRSELRSLYWEWLGLVHESRNQIDKALDAYSQWLESDPVAVEPLDRLGSLLVLAQRWTDVVLLRPHYVERAERLEDADAYESVALYFFLLEQLGSEESDDEHSPLERCYKALQARPDSLPMRYLLGVHLYRNGNLEAARAEFERVLQLDPDNAWVERRFSLMWDAATARMMLARIARIQGRPQEALELLSQNFSLHDDDSEGLLEVATVLLDHGQYQELLRVLPAEEESALSLNRFRAESLLGLGRVAEAHARYQIELRGERGLSIPTPSEMGLSDSQEQALAEAERLLASGATHEALERVRRLSSKKNPVWPVLWVRARCYAKLGRWQKALEQLETLLPLEPALGDAWSLLSRAARETGQGSLAKLAALQAEKLRESHQPEAGVLVFSPEVEGLAGLRLEARALSGEGNLWVTGDFEDCLRRWSRVALTVLRTDSQALRVEDPRYRDLHLHARALWLDSPSEDTLGEEVAAGILAVLGVALSETVLRQTVVVGGRLDLSGQIRGPLALEEGLSRLDMAHLEWDAVAAPGESSPELLRLPAELWLNRRLYLCRSAAELLQAITSAEGGR